MTSLSWLIYAISTITNLQTFLILLLFLSGVGSFMLFLFGYLEDNPTVRNWGKRSIITALITGFILVFIPDKEYLIMIAGAEVTNVVLQQDSVKQAGSQLGGLSNDAVNLLRNYIQKQTEELNNTKK